MLEVALDGLAKHVEEGTIQTWFFEEGDPVHEGDELVEINTEDGMITIAAPVSGILAEVYYDEGETIARGEILCTVDDNEGAAKDEDEDEEESEDDSDEDEDEDGEEEEDEEDDDEEDEDEEE